MRHNHYTLGLSSLASKSVSPNCDNKVLIKVKSDGTLTITTPTDDNKTKRKINKDGSVSLLKSAVLVNKTSPNPIYHFHISDKDAPTIADTKHYKVDLYFGGATIKLTPIDEKPADLFATVTIVNTMVRQPDESWRNQPQYSAGHEMVMA